jgi:hypothetical protein
MSPTRYRRIKLCPSDADKSYEVLISYLQNPELATSVEELVIREAKEFHHQFEHKNPIFLSNSHTKLIDSALSKVEVLSQEQISTVREMLFWKGGNIINNEAYEGEPRSRSMLPNSRYLRIRYTGAAALMFIMLCPNIRIIKLPNLPLELNFLETFLWENNYSVEPKYLRNLKHVGLLEEYMNDDERFYRRVKLKHILRQFHRLPAFESLHAATMYQDPDSDVESLPLAVSNLKTIHIEKSDISSRGAAEVIRLSRGLEEVKISVGGRWTEDGATGIMVPGHIGRALLYHRHSLESLDLDLDSYLAMTDNRSHFYNELEAIYEDRYYGLEPGNEEPDYEPWHHKEDELDAQISNPPHVDDRRLYGSSIGSLHDFPNLMHLSIGIKMLLGMTFPLTAGFLDVLPPSLESLTLRGYRKGEVPDYDDAVEVLMTNKAKFPKLKVILGVDEQIPNSDAPDIKPEILEEWRRGRPGETVPYDDPYVDFWEPEGADEGWEKV